MLQTSDNLNSANYLSGPIQFINDKVEYLLGDYLSNFFLTIVEAIVWLVILFSVDFLLQRISKFIFGVMVRHSKLKWLQKFHKHRVFRTVIHFVTIYILILINPYIFGDFTLTRDFLSKIVSLLIIAVFILLIFRIVDSIVDIYNDEETHASVAVRAVGQLIKVLAVCYGIIVFIATMFNLEISNILTVLGALTAVLMLIFKDSILGFVSGLQIATTKSIKIGDWVTVSKYGIEGTVTEINLTDTKILNFDKTISTIPTYDLVSSEVTNNSRMSVTNTRRIKRPIVFNINSFSFCDDEMLEKFKKFDLITDYINEKQKELAEFNKDVKNTGLIINGRQLTNIGVFRVYAINYLKNRDDISQTDTLVVRQLPQTSLGLPMEVYCFADTSSFADYERIQADVFDHLLSAAKNFGLQVSQPFYTQS